MVSFPVLSVVVCAWSTTPKLRGRPASVGLAQAHPNYTATSSVCLAITAAAICLWSYKVRTYKALKHRELQNL